MRAAVAALRAAPRARRRGRRPAPTRAWARTAWLRDKQLARDAEAAAAGAGGTGAVRSAWGVVHCHPDDELSLYYPNVDIIEPATRAAFAADGRFDDDEPFGSAPHVLSSNMLVENTAASRALAAEWLAMSLERPAAYCQTPTPDQATLSFLVRRHGLALVNPCVYLHDRRAGGGENRHMEAKRADVFLGALARDAFEVWDVNDTRYFSRAELEETVSYGAPPSPPGLSAPSPSAFPLVFQIGMNRAGTSSLCMLAREAARDDEFCAHWRGREGSIAHAMLLNDRAGRALLAGVDTSRTRVFTDMEVTHDDLYVHAYLDYWRRLRAEHPAARFVLNTRREDDWTRSRLRWQGGDYARRWARHHGVDPGDADAVGRGDGRRAPRAPRRGRRGVRGRARAAARLRPRRAPPRRAPRVPRRRADRRAHAARAGPAAAHRWGVTRPGCVNARARPPAARRRRAPCSATGASGRGT